MSVLKHLNGKRGQIKAKLSRFVTFVNGCNDDQIENLRSREERARGLLDEFDVVQGEIEALEEDSGEIAESDGERARFEEMYYDALAQAGRMLRVELTSTPNRPLLNETVVEPTIKLPMIKLPEFSGSYNEWQAFKDSFYSLIHENHSLSESQKLHYLKGQLKGDALRVIQSLEVTNLNYNIALDLLRKRFENTRLAVNNHIQAIFDIPPLAKENHKQLRSLSDTMTKSIRCLRALKEPVDSWGTLLIYIVSAKFDPVTKRKWEGTVFAKELPCMQELTEFLNTRCNLLEVLQPRREEHNDMGGHRKPTKVATYAANVLNKCAYCNETHELSSCNRFKAQPVESRLSSVKALRLCYNCLNYGHTAFRCRAPRCDICKKRIHKLLHLHSAAAASFEVQGNPQLNANMNEAVPAGGDFAFVSSSKQTFLSTAVVDAIRTDGQHCTCRVLLDNASSANFVTENMCSILGLKPTKRISEVHGLGAGVSKINQQCKITIRSRCSNYRRSITCLVLPEITGLIPAQSIECDALSIPVGIKLADAAFYESGGIQMLLGVDIYYEILGVQRMQLGRNMPILQETLFGWIVAGSISSKESRFDNKRDYSCCAIENVLSKFWEIEQVEETPGVSVEDVKCEDLFVETTERDATGRFIVRLPFRESIRKLGRSKHIAERRFYAMERRLERNGQLQQSYAEFLQEYLLLGHMEKINNLVTGQNYFLPHHAVLKESNSTKCRVVFDGSAATDTKLSLNDTLMTGPRIQSELFTILLRFRKHKYVLSADIEKMFRQILIHEPHRNFQLILWRSRRELELDSYVLRTLVYGLSSSPFLATRVLKQLAIESRLKYPVASAVLESDMYMDDLLTGTETIEDARQLREDLTNILSAGCFNMRKWLANDSRIINEENVDNDHLKVIAVTDDSINKTLGVLWNPRRDTLQYSVKELVVRETVTKREMLSEISRLWDPLGLINPVIVVAKLLMQKLWQVKVSWDENVDSELHKAWMAFAAELPAISNVRLPRRAVGENAARIELHGFSDASERAYGACIYLRTTTIDGEIVVNLLCAKSRVAPLKKVSLPRLELCAAVLLARLSHRVYKDLQLKVDEKHYWCDSMVALSWIRGDSGRWKTFVANRVVEIQSLTKTTEWKYVATKENVSDILSRGCTPSKLLKNESWWYGPQFLKYDPANWPLQEKELGDSNCLEMKRVSTVLVVTVGDTDIFSKYSSFNKMLRIYAYCFRFVENARCPEQRKTGQLTSDELTRTLQNLIRIAQTQGLPEDVVSLSKGVPLKRNSKLNALNPFMDKFKLIRVGGRLQGADLEYDSKHPVILPANSKLTFLIAKNVHEMELHCGPQALLATLRLKFWPIAGKNLVKKVVHSCMKCFRVKPKNVTCQMGELPRERIVPAPPFYYAGCDYAGPFLMRDKKGRGCKTIKGYVCLFICFTTKAIHLELVTGLTTDSFIAALRRFVGRRGAPNTIFSDNGTNFIGARNELKELGAFLEQSENVSKIQGALIERNINWKVIPPRAPHFGGLWEAGVKSMKYHLKRIAGNAMLVYEEFCTLLIQIEAVLNSRPLASLSDNPQDLIPLTPGHFLIGRPMTAVLDEDLVQVAPNRLNLYQRVQQMTQHFWTRWHKEYLTELQQRKKWKANTTTAGLVPGALVVIKQDDVPPCKWHLGRIVELHPGPDQLVRVATVRTSSGVFKRAIVKLCVLPLADSSDSAVINAPRDVCPEDAAKKELKI